MANKKPDTTDLEILSGGTTPRNAAERSGSTDYVVEKAVTEKDPIPTTPPNWAKDLPKTRR
jgi:hypothetical protein